MGTNTSLLEIHFHAPDHVSVYLEIPSSGQQEEETELTFFVLFSLRMMYCLGECAVTNELATLLSQGEEIVGGLAEGYEPGGVRLTEYAGTPGRKCFLASLAFADGEPPVLDLQPQGLGDDARGAGYYGPTAILAFLRYLTQRRPRSGGHVSRLGRAAKACASLYFSGSLGTTNAGTYAEALVKMLFFRPYVEDALALLERASAGTEGGNWEILDSWIEKAGRTLRLVLYFYSITTDSGGDRTCRAADSLWIMLWQKRAEAEAHLAKCREESEHIQVVTVMDVFQMIHSIRDQPESGVSGFYLNCAEGSDGTPHGRIVTVDQFEEHVCKQVIALLTPPK